MTETTATEVTVVTYQDWPVGAQIEQTDANTWVWTSKRIAGKYLITRPELGIQLGWYRLLTPEELADYTWLPHRENTNETLTSWMWRAAQMEEGRLQEVQRSRNMRSDWALLNEALNEYADTKNMCGEYERQLSEWNDSFAELSLDGRTKTYEVEVTITATFTTTVEVEGTSEDDATEKAGDMDWDDVSRGLDLSDASDMNWEVENATAQ